MAVTNEVLPSIPYDEIHVEGNDGSGDDWCEDITDDDFNTSQMSRENNNRCSLYPTIGYRDGIIAGKEAAAQDAFKTGFLQSVSAGHNWGCFCGVTSAFASMPESLKDQLAGHAEAKSKLEALNKFAQCISTNDALKIFHERSLYGNLVQPHNNSERSEMGSKPVQLSKLSEDLRFM